MSTPTTATATLPPHAHYNSRHTHYPYVYTSTAAAAANAPPSASSPISTQYRNTLLEHGLPLPGTTQRLPHPHAAYYSPSTLAANNTNTAAVTASSNGIGLSAAANAARPVNRTATTANSRLAHDHQEYSPVMPPISVLPTANEPARKKRRSREPDWNKFYKNGLPKEIIVIDDTPEPDATGRSNPSVKVVQQNAAHHTAALAVAAASRPPAKKRKRDDEPQRLDPLHHNNSANNTTAATSLSSNGYPYEDPHAGQKRKRTRQQLAQETKKREIEVLGDTCPSYRPPPYPPKKAGEVNVRVIPDNSHSKNVKVDDDDGHYIVVPDADLTDRYQMVQLLGQGTFGKVVKARDRRRGKAVAIKIIRSVQKYRDASRIELRVLQTLKANDDENRNRCIHLRDCFDFRGHICIVMDLLGQSVFDFLKGNNFVPFPNSQIQSFARQLLTSVAFLHDLNLIHTDLKPENILLCDNTYQTFTYNRKIPSSSTSVNRQANQRRVLLDTEIRLIDFGSATFQDEYHSSVVSTRHYRAPEIILGLGWSFPCDIWSIGCILVEFYTGDALFQTHDNLEHLAMMEMVCGSRIDTHLIQGVNKMATRSGGNPAAKYFKRAKLDYPTAETTRASKRFVKAMKRLEDIIPHNNSYFKNFLDLLRKIFVYDPQHRITAKQALAHPWFKEAAHPDDGTEAAKIRLERLRMEQDNSHRLTHGYV